MPKQKSSKVAMKVAGETVSLRDWKKNQHGDAVGGIVFILAGIVLFLNTVGILSWTVWEIIFKFWPIILVLIGIHIILGNSRVSRILVGLLTAITFIFVVLFAVSVVKQGFKAQLPAQINLILNRMEVFQIKK